MDMYNSWSRYCRRMQRKQGIECLEAEVGRKIYSVLVAGSGPRLFNRTMFSSSLGNSTVRLCQTSYFHLAFLFFSFSPPPRLSKSPHIPFSPFLLPRTQAICYLDIGYLNSFPSLAKWGVQNGVEMEGWKTVWRTIQCVPDELEVVTGPILMFIAEVKKQIC